ncbi:MAG: PA domain-containing protein, partial [Bacteroidota bacterium]
MITRRFKSCINNYRLIAVLILFFSSIQIYAQINNEQSQQRIESIVKYLASDELEGRFPATPGNIKAAELISNHFKSIGLLPFNGSYNQNFEISTKLLLGKNNKLEIEKLVLKLGIPREMLKPITQKWILESDWKPMRFSDNGTVSGEIVFVGYGITAPDIAYDDYGGIDVKNKIVIILADSAEGQSKVKSFEEYAELRYKVSNARDHGAKAVIFVKTQSDSCNT